MRPGRCQYMNGGWKDGPSGRVAQFFCYSSRASACACSSQYVIPISRYIVVAVVRCSCACSRWPVRR
jgi:hypothetical protein